LRTRPPQEPRDFRITASFAFKAAAGAAWKKTSGAGREYLSVKLDEPSLPTPM
jgi:uncharacterized protein (DUF736 family)